jgi:site-specific DNA-methyltransferase (adenine-specific)
MIKLLKGNCLEQMKSLPDNSVDSIVTDPPYGISFMAKKWDYDVPSVEVWQEAMRVLKPGGHALIACGTRTQHRMVVNIEDAGFEIRDVVSWIYGSGFPKSLNISKAIAKTAGIEIEYKPTEDTHAFNIDKQWDGWGTALKPACEFFTLCRKPLSEKTVAANVLKWGTGGINIDGCRVETDGESFKRPVNHTGIGEGWDRPHKHTKDGQARQRASRDESERKAESLGRFPANLIHDGSQEVLELFPETKSSAGKKQTPSKGTNAFGDYEGTDKIVGHTDQGSAARFFYCPKASKKDRDEGLEGFEEKMVKTLNKYKNPSEGRTASKSGSPKRNNHPTVKPTALMQYLCRLITPTGGVVLDPYMGSGSTGKAAIKEGFGFVGCELDEDYFLIASQRVKNELD